MILAILVPLATVGSAENGSARYTQKMKHGTAAFLNLVTREARDNTRAPGVVGQNLETFLLLVRQTHFGSRSRAAGDVELAPLFLLS